MVHPISSSVETNPSTSPSPRGYPYKFDFRANHANVTVLARVEGYRKYFLMQPYFKIVK